MPRVTATASTMSTTAGAGISSSRPVELSTVRAMSAPATPAAAQIIQEGKYAPRIFRDGYALQALIVAAIAPTLTLRHRLDTDSTPPARAMHALRNILLNNRRHALTIPPMGVSRRRSRLRESSDDGHFLRVAHFRQVRERTGAIAFCKLMQ